MITITIIHLIKLVSKREINYNVMIIGSISYKLYITQSFDPLMTYHSFNVILDFN